MNFIKSVRTSSMSLWQLYSRQSYPNRRSGACGDGGAAGEG
ncbi:hypothetical protein [Desulfosporosinus fructosivorans]|nr:hypothetical protein [Desulfosporosinus fructosivorans]